MADSTRSHFVLVVWKRERVQSRSLYLQRLQAAATTIAGWDLVLTHARSFDVGIFRTATGAPHTSSGCVNVYPLLGVPGDLDEVLARDRRQDILPPYAGLSFSTVDNRFTILNDYVGIGRVYHLETAEAHIFASRLSLVVKVSGVQAVPDAAAAAEFGTAGWIMGDKTIVKGVQVLPPYSVVQLRRGRLWPNRLSWTHGTPISHEPEEPDLGRTVDHLVESVRSIREVHDGVLLSSLSGGRDSRLVNSLLSVGGLRFRCTTTNNFAHETEVARRVHEQLASEEPLEVREPRSPSDPSDLLDSARALVRNHEGMFEPAYVGRLSPADTGFPLPRRAPSLGGAGGELAHGHFYPRSSAQDLEAMTDTAAVEHLLNRFTSLGAGTAAGIEQLSHHLKHVQSDAETRSFRGAKMLDYFYLVERLRRWSGLADVSAWNIAPLTSLTFAQEALNQSAAHARESRLHRRLIEYLIPGLEAVPFFKLTRPASVLARPPFPASATVYDYIRSSGLSREAIDAARLDKAFSACADGAQNNSDEAVIKRALWLATAQEWVEGLSAPH